MKKFLPKTIQKILDQRKDIGPEVATEKLALENTLPPVVNPDEKQQTPLPPRPPPKTRRMSTYTRLETTLQRRRPLTWYFGRQVEQMGAAEDPANTILHSACINDQLDVVEFYSNKKECLHAQNSTLNSPLHEAIVYQREKAVAILLSKQPPLDYQNIDGDTVLHLALAHKMEDVAVELIQRQCDVTKQNKYGDTPLHIAACKHQVDAVRLLLRHGADVSVQNKQGNMPIHSTISHVTDVSVLKPMLEAVAAKRNKNETEATKQDNLLVSALDKFHEALKDGISQSVPFKTLIDTFKDPTTNRLPAILSQVCSVSSQQRQHQESILVPPHRVYRALERNKSQPIDSVNGSGETALHRAVKLSNVEVTQHLVELGGADASLKDSKGDTPLHIAVKLDKAEIARFLLERDFRLAMAKDKTGNTPLHIASGREHVKILALLLAKVRSSDFLNARNKAGLTSLHYAVIKSQWQSVVMLVKHHADVIVDDEQQETVLHYAVRKGNLTLIKYLLKHKRTLIDRQNNHGETAFHVAMSLLQENYGPHDDNRKSQSYLLNLHEICDVLLDNNINVNIQNHVAEDTCFHVALRYGDLDTIDKIVKNVRTRYDVLNAHGHTVLHAIAENNLVDCIKSVRPRPNDFRILNSENETPFDIAIRKQNLQMAETILHKAWGAYL